MEPFRNIEQRSGFVCGLQRAPNTGTICVYWYTWHTAKLHKESEICIKTESIWNTSGRISRQSKTIICYLFTLLRWPKYSLKDLKYLNALPAEVVS